MNKISEKTKKPGGRKLYKIDVFNEFVNWSALTNEEKKKTDVSTAKAFSKKFKVDETLLSRWKLRDDFENLRTIQLRKKLSEYTPEVLDALFRHCLKYGNSADIELWLILIEKWDRKKTLEEKPELHFGPNDVRALIAYLSPEKKRH